jgi:hypothetical protein
MPRFGLNRPGVGVIVLAGLVGAGCFDRHFVRPTELPKLNAGAQELEKTDGSHFEVKRPVTAIVTTPYGDQKFSQPVSRIDDGILTIRAGDEGPPVRFPLDQVNSVRVGQLNVVDTVASALVLAGIAVGSLLLIAWIRPEQPHGVQ